MKPKISVVLTRSSYELELNNLIRKCRDFFNSREDTCCIVRLPALDTDQFTLDLEETTIQ